VTSLLLGLKCGQRRVESTCFKVEVPLRLTVRQPVHSSWCRARSWVHDHILPFYSHSLEPSRLLSSSGAFSDERSSLSLLRLSHCSTYFKWIFATLLVGETDRLLCGTGGVTKGSLTVYIHLNTFLLTSQLNTPGLENPMFAGRQLQWPLIGLN
jgi:hypothetical protein